jgi:hypothetical protein
LRGRNRRHIYPSFLQTRSVTLTPVSESKFVAAADRMLAPRPDGRWSRALDETWCHLRPVGEMGPDQGWKLHLSASTDSAMEVLERALEVLLDAGCPLKFAASLDRLALLDSAHYPRGGAGQFITAYPGTMRCSGRWPHVWTR